MENPSTHFVNAIEAAFTPISLALPRMAALTAAMPPRIALHHCGQPNLEQRPRVFVCQHMLNLRKHYRGLGWKKGAALLRR